MVDYTTITDAQLEPNAPITSELMTALRNNADLGIFRAFYDIQTFDASGTWTKPAGALDTDIMEVWVWGAGAGGDAYAINSPFVSVAGQADGAMGGAGGFRVARAGDYGATESVTIGAGGAGAVSSSTPGVSGTENRGAAGGNTLFGTDGVSGTLRATGGASSSLYSVGEFGVYSVGGYRRPLFDATTFSEILFSGGAEGVTLAGASLEATIYGSAGSAIASGAANAAVDYDGTISMFGGTAGVSQAVRNISVFQQNTATGTNGFRGGGGGSAFIGTDTDNFSSSDTATGGDGGDGYCVVILRRGA